MAFGSEYVAGGSIVATHTCGTVLTKAWARGRAFTDQMAVITDQMAVITQWRWGRGWTCCRCSRRGGRGHRRRCRRCVGYEAASTWSDVLGRLRFRPDPGRPVGPGSGPKRVNRPRRSADRRGLGPRGADRADRAIDDCRRLLVAETDELGERERVTAVGSSTSRRSSTTSGVGHVRRRRMAPHALEQAAGPLPPAYGVGEDPAGDGE